MSIDSPTRKTIQLAWKLGRKLRIAEKKPPSLFLEAQQIYRGFSEINRDGMSGALVFSSMTAVLDEYGIADREERFNTRDLWRAMNAREHELRKKPDGPASS